jgi:hypothetical protein
MPTRRMPPERMRERAERRRKSRREEEEEKLEMLHRVKEHTPRPDMPHLLRKHGSRFVDGARHAINSVDAKSGHVVLVVGDHAHGDFVHALSHAAGGRTEHVVSHIVPPNHTVTQGSDELDDILDIIKRFRPDILMMAFNAVDWPARLHLFEASKKANPKRVLASMPGITYDAVREILPMDPALMRERTTELQRFIEGSRGEDILISTERDGTGYELKGRVPESARLRIVADAEVAEPGVEMHIPGGRTIFQPDRLNGEVFLPPKTVVGGLGSVQDGIEMMLKANTLKRINAVTYKDVELVRRILVRLKAMDCFRATELGIGTHPHIDMGMAGSTSLLIEKVVNTFHLGFGDSARGGWGNVRASDHFNFVVPNGRLRIAGKLIVPRKQ